VILLIIHLNIYASLRRGGFGPKLGINQMGFTIMVSVHGAITSQSK